MSGFNLDDYVPVAERLAAFYGKYPEGSIQSDIIELSDNRVVMRATVYRTPADERPAVAHSALGIPGTTSYTRGSEIENAETSAAGRAIAMLGFEVKRGVASREEVRNKQDDGPAKTTRRDVTHEAPQIAQDGLIGTVEKGKPPVDMEPRQTPNGLAWGFKLKDGSRSFQVLATGSLADVLSMVPDLTGQRVQVFGTVEMVPWDKQGKAMPPFARIHMAKIVTPEFTLPSDLDGAEPESVPLFDDLDTLADAEARVDMGAK